MTAAFSFDQWVSSPGFGGAAAIVAAAVAAAVAWRRGVSVARQAAEARWWDLAKWAMEHLENRSDQRSVTIGLLTLEHLAAEARAGSAAARFVRTAVEPLVIDTTADSDDLPDEAGESSGGTE